MTTTATIKYNPFLAEMQADAAGIVDLADRLDMARHYWTLMSALLSDHHNMLVGTLHSRFDPEKWANIDRENDTFERLTEVLRHVGTFADCYEAIEALDVLFEFFPEEKS